MKFDLLQKKSEIFVAILGIILCLLSGCNSKETSQNGSREVTLRWVTDTNPARKEQIALFEKKNQGIKIIWDWDNGLRKILTQTAGGSPPDIFDIYLPDQLTIFARKKALLDLTPYCQRDNIDLKDFWPQCAPYMYYDGKVYAFPDAATSMVLFYNKRLFDEVNVPYPDETWTWQTLLYAAQRLTKVDVANKRYDQFGLYWSYWQSLLWQNGGEMFTPDGKRCIIDSPGAKEARQFLYDLRFKYNVMPTPEQLRNISGAQLVNQEALRLFGAEKIAMFDMGRWAIVTLRMFKNIDWDIAILPKGKCRANLFLSRTTAISSKCRYPEEAFKFLKFLCSEEYNAIIARGGDSFPALQSIARSPLFFYDPEHPLEKNNQIYLNEMKYTRNPQLSPYVDDFEINRIQEYESELMWTQQQTPEQTADNIAMKVNQLIK